MKKVINSLRRFLGRRFPLLSIRLNFLRKIGRLPNLKHPQDLNEKIQWLKLHGDMSVWAELADKYKVRDYVSGKGLDNILVPLLGKFNSVQDFALAWDSLEAPFVIKANNSCKTLIVVKDKSQADLQSILRQIGKWLNDSTFWGFYFEPHYRLIDPCIVVERFLQETGPAAEWSSSLVDYKVWCFNGRPECICVYFDRTPSSVRMACFDTEWKEHPERLVYSDHFRRAEVIVPCPEGLDKMLEYASVLSAGFPQVRVDFYNTAGRIWFGEMTFTSNGGYMDYFTPAYLKEMGNLCRLPEKE